MICWESDLFRFFWKNAEVPSSFGVEKSFLDAMKNYDMNFGDIDNHVFAKNDIKNAVFDTIDSFGYKKYENVDFIKQLIDKQINVFGEKQEYGLVNRLDNDTSGFLYFAKSQDVYKKYKSLQQDKSLCKTYIACIVGDVRYFFGKDDTKIVSFPIMHHIQLNDRMVVLKTDKDLLKGRGNKHNCETKIKLLKYDEKEKFSIINVQINKGIRHQIRVHMSGIGYPILGDDIYNKNISTKDVNLQLFSVGVNLNCKTLEVI